MAKQSRDKDSFPVVLTADEARERLRIGRTAFYSLVRAGQIPHFRIGRLLRFTESDLREFIERNREET